MVKARHWSVLVALVCVFTTHAAAETATPQRTTATFDDWVERCQIAGPTKTCEIAQAMEIHGQSEPVTQIAIGRVNKDEPMKIVFQVPINVWLPAGVKFSADEKNPAIVASFSRCVPTACLADVNISEDQLKVLEAAKQNGKLQFKDAAKRDVIIPVSFKGFDEAYRALRTPG